MRRREFHYGAFFLCFARSAFEKSERNLQISLENFKKSVVIKGNLWYHIGWKTYYLF